MGSGGERSPLHELVTEVLQDAAHWGEDLTAIHGLADQVTRYLEMILRAGMREALSAAVVRFVVRRPRSWGVRFFLCSEPQKMN